MEILEVEVLQLAQVQPTVMVVASHRVHQAPMSLAHVQQALMTRIIGLITVVQTDRLAIRGLQMLPQVIHTQGHLREVMIHHRVQLAVLTTGLHRLLIAALLTQEVHQEARIQALVRLLVVVLLHRHRHRQAAVDRREDLDNKTYLNLIFPVNFFDQNQLAGIFMLKPTIK
jgi:hypothetical protein